MISDINDKEIEKMNELGDLEELDWYNLYNDKIIYYFFLRFFY